MNVLNNLRNLWNTGVKQGKFSLSSYFSPRLGVFQPTDFGVVMIKSCGRILGDHADIHAHASRRREAELDRHRFSELELQRLLKGVSPFCDFFSLTKSDEVLQI